MKVVADKRGTVRCGECGGLEVRWSSALAGDLVEMPEFGDLVLWCRDCAEIRAVDLWRVPDDVMMWAGDLGWRDRVEWYHYGSVDWWDECPGEVRVHVGSRETSEWVSRHAENAGREDGALWKVSVDCEGIGFGRDWIWNDWPEGHEECGYVNVCETPGRVSLYVDKSRLGLVERVW